MKTRSLMTAAAVAAMIIAFGAGCGGSDGEGDNDVTPGTPFSNDSGMKSIGDLPPPPFFVEPEGPAAGGEVAIVVAIDGATGIAFTAAGPGCGTIASTEGANPLTVTGTAGDRGYCDMTATATGGVVQSYAGRFEVEATDPRIPPIGLGESLWDQDDLPEADAGGPVITAINGPASVTGGGSGAYTISFTGDEEIEAVLLQVEGYPHGYFFSATSGGRGVAGFDLEATWGASSGTYNATVIVIDALDRASAAFPTTFVVQGTLSADISAAITPASQSVSGKVMYEKFIVGKTGRAKTGTMVPVRSATVKAISANRSATVLGQATTAKDGTYRISFRNTTGEPRYYVRVYASSDALKQSVMSKSGAVYSFRKAETINGTESPDETDYDLEIKEADNAGAFNIWDVAVSANSYTKTAANTAPPQLGIYWTRLGADGSYYSTNSGSPQIWMKGARDDPDEWDDMVIGHEYGHFVMGNLSTDDSPGGEHSIESPASPTLALSEAWATFFAGATLGSSFYIDTDGSGGIYSAYSFETPPASVPRGSWTGATKSGALAGNVSETAINAVLWDYYDQSNETMDTLEDKSTAIWNVMTTYLKSGYAKFADRGYEGRDLVDFLDGWICLGYGSVGDSDEAGLRGAAIGLMEMPAEYIKADLASCR